MEEIFGRLLKDLEDADRKSGDDHEGDLNLDLLDDDPFSKIDTLKYTQELEKEAESWRFYPETSTPGWSRIFIVNKTIN